MVRFYGQGASEGANVTIRNPKGEVVFQGEDVADAMELDLGNTEGKTAGIWTIRLDMPTSLSHEDFNILIAGVPIFLATSPELVPVPAK